MYLNTEEFDKLSFSELYAYFQYAQYRQELNEQLRITDKEITGYLFNVRGTLDSTMREKFYDMFPHPDMEEEWLEKKGRKRYSMPS